MDKVDFLSEYDKLFNTSKVNLHSVSNYNTNPISSIN